MADPTLALAEFEKLLERRELAAVHCVSVIQFVLLMFEANDFEQSRKYLQEALDQHKAANAAIDEFYSRQRAQSKKENQSHGNANSQSADVA